MWIGTPAPDGSGTTAGAVPVIRPIYLESSEAANCSVAVGSAPVTISNFSGVTAAPADSAPARMAQQRKIVLKNIVIRSVADYFVMFR